MEDFLPSRRRLMQAASVLLANGLAPWPGLAAPALDDWRQEFAAALPHTPWLIGWRDPGVEGFDTAQLPTEGRWPSGLSGRFLRNGPARHERGAQRYRHWFDGDGMVHRYTLASGRISHRARMVRTQKYQAEAQAGRFLVPGFGTRFPGTVYNSPDGVNVANINVLPVADQLLALWEGGSAWSLDPDSLEAQGPKHWRDDLVHMPFSAHPKVEPDGTIWNFGTSVNGHLLLYHIGADGRLKRFVTLALDRASMIHDFIVTERHLIFLLAPLILERERITKAGASFLDAHVWHGDRPTRVMAIPKDEPDRVRRYDLAPGFTFHFGNGWEEADGTLRFDHCRRADPSVMYKTLSSVMRGAVERSAPARWTLVTLYPDGRASERDVGPEVEFTRVDPRVVGRRNRYVYMLEASPKLPHPMFDTVVRRDVESGAADRYSYGPSFLAEEHCFIPRPGSAREGDGWLIGTALEWRRGQTCLSLFDAANLASGPMARAWLPYAVPLGLHGVWQG